MSDAGALREKAWEHFKAKRWGAAIAVYDEILKLDPDDASTLSSRGAARRSNGDAEGAVKDLTRGIELKPDNINARFNRGLALVDLGRFGDALPDFEAYLAGDPKDADALRMRARCRAEAGEIEEHDGRLVAAPRALARVPAHLRIEEGFGWGTPTFGASLTVGGLFLISAIASKPKPADPAFLAGVGAAALLGVVIVALHLRNRRRALTLVPTEQGAAIYREGKKVADAARSDFTLYVHSLFNTLYIVAMLGLALFGAAMLAEKEPGVLLTLAPVIAMLASNLRSRIAFTHVYVLRGEGTSMFSKGAFERAFGA